MLSGFTLQLPYFSSAACGSKQTRLVACEDSHDRDPFYDYYDATAEVQCADCGAFSAHIQEQIIPNRNSLIHRRGGDDRR